ncbi:ribosomal protein S18-alanine N-acetyltransferase [Weissella kandleri]|uniref:ribosomal protein S18-alanine N-acetyltransferase n=1 Tax=Weissella kandleri TaxID=1616 RepID=UPI00387E35F8
MWKKLNKWWQRSQQPLAPEIQKFEQTIVINQQHYLIAVAKQGDVADIFAVEEAAYYGVTPWPLEVFADEIARTHERLYLILRTATTNEMVAYAGAVFAAGAKDAHVTNVAVLPAWQRQGLAQALLTYTMSLAVQHHYQSMTLEVQVDNCKARRLYQKIGFTDLRLRRDYYGPGVDAQEMRVSLGGELQ